jgi:hypothetical protein
MVSFISARSAPSTHWLGHRVASITCLDVLDEPKNRAVLEVEVRIPGHQEFGLVTTLNKSSSFLTISEWN